MGLWGIAAFAVSIVLWLALITEGKVPRTLQAVRDLVPPLLGPGSAYLNWRPARIQRSGAATAIRSTSRSSRPLACGGGRVAARLVLAVPALLLALAVGGGASAAPHGRPRRRRAPAGRGLVGRRRRRDAAVLAWFAAVALGRTPRGLRDLIVYASGTRLRPSATGCSSRTGIRPGTPGESSPHRLSPASGAARAHRSPRSSRLTVFFRSCSTIPHLIWLILWTVLAASP